MVRNNTVSNRTASNMLVNNNISFVIGHDDTDKEVGSTVFVRVRACVCACVQCSVFLDLRKPYVSIP